MQVIGEATATTVRIKYGGVIKAECNLPSPHIVVSPTSLNFGNVVEGTQSTKQVTIQNTGTAALTFSITSNNPMYTLSPANGTIAASSSQTINVTFSPPLGSQGTKNGELSIIHNDPGQVFTVKVSLTGSIIAAVAQIGISTTSISFGGVVEGNQSTKQFSIQNTGTATLNFTIASSNSMFMVSPPSGFVSSSGVQTVYVTFFPPSQTPPGQQSGNLTITHNDPNTASKTISLSGTVLAAEPKIHITPLGLIFGDVVEGEQKTKQFTIENTGTASLTFSINSSNSQFTATPASGTIAASGSQAINVVFTAPLGVLGPETGLLNITHNDPNNISPQVISLTANTVAATRVISAQPITLDFGNVGLTYALTKIIKVMNTGNSLLTISGITSSNSNFTVNAAMPVQIMPGGDQKDIEVTLTPADIGPETGQLNFQSDATAQSPTVSLTGEGIEAPIIDAFLVLDRSGSMSESAGNSLTKMDRLKSAANLFLDLIRTGQGDKLGIVQFDSPTTDYVTHLSLTTSINNLTMKNAVNSLVPSGWTSIGKGLELAFNELTDPSISSADHRALILLSDGEENRSPFVDPANGSPTLNLPSQPNIEIYTIGLGLAENMNVNLLSDLAFNSIGNAKGYFHLTNDNWYTLHKFFISIFGDTFNQYIIQDPVYAIGMGEYVTIPIYVTESDKDLTIAYYWNNRDSKFSSEVTSPTGQVWTNQTADSMGVEYKQGDLYSFYKFTYQNRQSWYKGRSGKWTLKLTGSSIPLGINKDTVSVSVLSSSNLSFKPSVSKGIYSTGEPIILKAEFLDKGIPLESGEVEVEITKPSAGLGNILSTMALSSGEIKLFSRMNSDMAFTPVGKKIAILKNRFNGHLIDYDKQIIILHDDGAHGDGVAGDGVYSNIFQNTMVGGVYSFRFKATGRTKYEERATREKTISTTVEVNNISTIKSVISIDKISDELPGYHNYTFSIVPKDLYGNYVGPGYVRVMEFQTEQGKFMGTVADDNSGTYSQVISVPDSIDINKVNMSVSLQGRERRLNIGDQLEYQNSLSGFSISWWWLLLLLAVIPFINF